MLSAIIHCFNIIRYINAKVKRVFEKRRKGKKRYSEKKPKPRREKETFPHFRYYKKSKHPALIIGEQPVDEYKFRKVMHSEREGGQPNEKVYPNPNPKDPKPMYIGKRVRHDKKTQFESYKLPWNYPKK